ncbi:MAG: TetR/AcrR family transcriptional regulator [Atopobiaceae bacterium]
MSHSNQEFAQSQDATNPSDQAHDASDVASAMGSAASSAGTTASSVASSAGTAAPAAGVTSPAAGSPSSATDSEWPNRRTHPKNRNSQRSLDLMETAFWQLLTQKPLQKISVADVTRTAGLNRGTFYAHFGGIADLENYVMDQAVNRVLQLADEWDGPSFFDDPMPLLQKVSDFIQEHRDTWSKLAGVQSMEPLFLAAEHQLRIRVHQQIKARMGSTDMTNTAIVATDYLTQGIMGAYRAFLNGEYGTHTMAEVNAELVRLIKATGSALYPEVGPVLAANPSETGTSIDNAHASMGA